MTYTLWSHGRLVGETELAYARCMVKARAGDFYPTEFGQTLMPVATGAVPAAMELSRATRKAADDPCAPAEALGTPPHVVRRTASEYADFAAACDQRDALDLELRRPDGSIVPTEWIDIRDTEYLQSLVFDDDVDHASFALDTEGDRALEDAIDADIALLEEWGLLGGDDDLDGTEDGAGTEKREPWEDAFPRYQIQLELLNDGAIP